MTRNEVFRTTIIVFGERLRVLYVDNLSNPKDPIILYENLTDKKQPNRSANMSDWIAWDQNELRAKAARK